MNLSRILKALLPSLVPLIVYVAADAFFGEKIGLLVGVGVGLVEFVVILVRDRKPDPFVAADTGLLVLAGAISLASGNDLFFKLKPAIIELVFGASFALFLVLPPRYLASWMGRQLKGLELPESAIPAMRRSLGAMLAVLALHSILTVYAALRLSDAAWGFISGVLLYILFGLVVLGEFLASRAEARKLRSELGTGKGERILPVVDEEGRVTGQAPERICHPAAAGDSAGVLHPALRLHVVDGSGQVFLRRRPEGADGSPAGPWDVAVSRHVELGEDLEAALKRALRESLGVAPMALEAAKAAPQGALRYRRDAEGESELVFVYFLSYGGPFALDAAGGQEGRFLSPAELNAAAADLALAPRFVEEYNLLSRPPEAAAGPAD